MRAGSLRHTVAADEPIQVSDGAGGMRTDWVQRLVFKAAVEPLTGAELLRADQVIASTDARITLRWTPAAAAIRPNWRLRHAGEVYNITRPPIEHQRARRVLEILVRSGFNEG